MRNALLIVVVFISSCLVFLSCSKKGATGGDNPAVCDAVPKAFQADVNPLIQTFCNQPLCHNTGSVNGPGPLTNYTQVFNARIAIRGQVAVGSMPKNTTLTTAQKNTIICWIDNGAPND